MVTLVTGAAGFIGSELIRQLLADGHTVWALDALTYAGREENLESLPKGHALHFEKGDVCDRTLLNDLFQRAQPNAVLHLAAESHVDRSIDAPADFIRTNILGTYTLLEASLEYFNRLSGAQKATFRFIQISTDEVFGSLGKQGIFNEDSPYRPNSPYSASKASADHLVRAWNHTYGLPTLTLHSSNNYGPRQYHEKLIPHFIKQAIEGKALTLYGDGLQIRDWLHVEDHCRGIRLAIKNGKIGDTYCFGGGTELTNLELTELLCQALDRLSPRMDGRSYSSQITFVKDRPGHDFRYSLDFSKAKIFLGYAPTIPLQTGLLETVRWYLTNRIPYIC